MGEDNELFAEGTIGEQLTGVWTDNDRALTGHPIHQHHQSRILELAVQLTPNDLGNTVPVCTHNNVDPTRVAWLHHWGAQNDQMGFGVVRSDFLMGGRIFSCGLGYIHCNGIQQMPPPLRLSQDPEQVAADATCFHPGGQFHEHV
jgi:hypothetical protein